MYYLRSVYAPRSICAAAIDATCLLASFAWAWFAVGPPMSPVAYAGAALFTLGGVLTALYFNNAYRPESIGDRSSTISAILATMGFGLVAAVLIYWFVPLPERATPTLASIATSFVPLLILGRMGLRSLLRTRWLTTNVVIIGATDLGLGIARLITRRQSSGIRFLGFLSDDAALHQHGGMFGGHPVIATVGALEKVLRDHPVDYVVVASKDRHEYFPANELMAAKMTGIRVESGVSFHERLAGRVHMRDLRASYLIFGHGFVSTRFIDCARRVVDLVGATALLAAASPFLMVTAIAIKLESRGPVLFRQERLGKDDKPFMMNKLRSMRHEAEAETGAVFTSEDDPRITRVGAFTRRTRLDELPQLWNVIRGEMSLVGPRAERAEFVEELRARYPYYAYRTSVKPGVTGWAQTRFGYVNTVEAYEEKLELDLYYLKYRSLLLDLTILAQTAKTVLCFRGM